MPDTSRIFSLLFSIGRSLRDEGGEHRKFSMLHFQTLRYVKSHKKPLINDVAKFLRVTPPAATLLVEGMVKDRLLARSRGKSDRRAVHLSLTSRGKAFLAHGIAKKIKKLRKMFSVLTTAERAAFVTILQKIAKDIE